jgi:hypothetical protein
MNTRVGCDARSKHDSASLTGDSAGLATPGSGHTYSPLLRNPVLSHNMRHRADADTNRNGRDQHQQRRHSKRNP